MKPGDLTKIEMSSTFKGLGNDVYLFQTMSTHFWPHEGHIAGKVNNGEHVMIVAIIERWVYAVSSAGAGWLYAENVKGTRENLSTKRQKVQPQW